MIVRYLQLPLIAFTIALSLSGAAQADTAPCYLCDNIGKLKNLPEPPPEPPKNNACIMLIVYVQIGSPMSKLLEYVEGCNNHPDKAVCESIIWKIEETKIDPKKLGLTCKNSD